MTACSDLTVIDYFCGMGGTSSGLREAGWRVLLAANHSVRAIQTHSANHPDTEHLCADIQTIDVRYLPRARALWASPICTEISPAGGRRRTRQMDLFEDHGHVPSAAFERTRVTFWEVIRAAEVWRYDAVMIENVVEAARDWELFDVWLSGMTALGYNHQFVSVSAAHVDAGGYAPQWRDRLYIVFTSAGIPLSDVDPRPLAWCVGCGEDVAAVQWWKPRKGQKAFVGRKIGKFGDQYVYVCPRGNHGIVEPYVLPAAAAIDWTDLGTRIGDWTRPRAAATMRRIQMGLEMIGDPALVAAAGNTYDGASGAGNQYLRAWPAAGAPHPTQVGTVQNGLAMSGKFVMAINHDSGRHFDPDTRPLAAQTTRSGESLVTAEPFVTMLRKHGTSRPTGSEPLATFSTGRHHGLTMPPGAFIMKQYGGRLADRDAVKSVATPLPAAVAQSAPHLVIPYRKGAKPYPADAGPLSTVATRGQHGVLRPEIDINDAYFRMLKPREAANAQRFDPAYVIHGNKGEQQLQAGNAVPVNVARWLGERVGAVL